MNRREFLRTATLSSAAVMFQQALARGQIAESRPAGKMPRRAYGKTGIELSILGFPGFALKDQEPALVKRMVAEGVERGMNYFDVAPSYGNAEELLGPALAPYRKDVFLACKTAKRDRAGAEAELKRSLELLKTDHFDLYQLHHITDMTKDVDAAFGKGGAMEVLIEAKKAGVVKHLGFSAHSVEAALAAMDRYDFDSILFPFNFACMMETGFGPQVMKTAQEKGVARLALKAMAKQQWPKDHPDRKKFWNCWYEPMSSRHDALLGLRYTLSLPVTSACPPASPELYKLALDLAMEFRPISGPEEQELKTLAARVQPIFGKRA